MLRPLSSANSTPQNYGQVNDMMRQLNKEQVTKTFKQASGNAIVQGRLPFSRYGALYYSTDGLPATLLGQAPDDGRNGFWIIKPTKNVIEELGG